jgi:membrane fusion protein (multidrug efflux system)
MIRHLPALTALAFLTLLPGCGEEAAKPTVPSAVPVEWIVLQAQDVPLESRILAQTKANSRVEIRARVAGTLLTQGFSGGDKVQKGQLLFEIDRRPFEASLSAAKAQVVQAQAKLDEANATVERKRKLVAAEAAAQKELDDALTAQAGAGAQLEIARSSQEQAQLNLDYTRLTSTITGRIGKGLRDVGSLVDAGQNSLLAVVQEIDPIVVTFRMSEKDLLHWRRGLAEGRFKVANGDAGLRVAVETADGKRYPGEGAISFVGVEVDPSTGTAEINAKLANASEGLLPGQFVTAIIGGATRPNTLTVPQRAVMVGAEGMSVYVVDDKSTAQLRPVQLAAWRGGDWIVESGLAAGDKLIVQGVQKIRPGAPVKQAGAGSN